MYLRLLIANSMVLILIILIIILVIKETKIIIIIDNLNVLCTFNVCRVPNVSTYYLRLNFRFNIIRFFMLKRYETGNQIPPSYLKGLRQPLKSEIFILHKF